MPRENPLTAKKSGIRLKNMPAIEEKIAAPATGTAPAQSPADPLVQRLTEWENTKGSSERLQAFKKVIETLYNEHA